MKKTYSEYLEPRPNYYPVMTKEVLEKVPNRWLDFYPHASFMKILKELFIRFDSDTKSVWVTGAYGTGKSHAALVIQKLFSGSDDEVGRYLERYASVPTMMDIREKLAFWRKQKVLAVYTMGSDTVVRPEHLLIRIEQAVASACRREKLKVPVLGMFESLLKRVERECTNGNFFKVRDRIQGELAHLTPDITDFQTLKERLYARSNEALMDDVIRVLEADNIVMAPTADTLLEWVKKILEQNQWSKCLFLWDEFSSYINNAKGNLKTFEMLAEPKAQQCGFYFVPITHIALEAFEYLGAESAKKSRDRYTFCPIEIPVNQVFKLGAEAFIKPDPGAWEEIREALWSGIAPLVQEILQYVPESEQLCATDFKEILPLHPMCAYLLRYLAERVGSNQRSFFDYLCVQDGESEFQRFLLEGGLNVSGRQYLMVDYLWNYFVAGRSELAISAEVTAIQAQFSARASLLGKDPDSPQVRVYKVVLLYCLMERLARGRVQELLSPTVANISRAFRGDGRVTNPSATLKELEQKNCFTIAGERILLLANQQVDVAPYREKFDELLVREIEKPLAEQIAGKCRFGKVSRFQIRVLDGATFKSQDLGRLNEYGASGNSILLCCLLARDPILGSQIEERIKQVHAPGRIIFLTFPRQSFCEPKQDAWEHYIEMYARAKEESDAAARQNLQRQNEQVRADWKRRLFDAMTITLIVKEEEELHSSQLTWAMLKNALDAWRKKWFPNSLDDIRDHYEAIKTMDALEKWAQTGLLGRSPIQKGGGTYGTFLTRGHALEFFKDQWIEDHPQEPLARLTHELDTELDAVRTKNLPCSLTKLYERFSRPPYGFLREACSAFAFGFAMRRWISQGLQCSDGRITKPLTVEELANLIKGTIADSSAYGREWRICGASEEERCFAADIPRLFDLNLEDNVSCERVLSELGGQISAKCDNVPLWMVADLIHAEDDEGRDPLSMDMERVLRTLCTLLSISAKDNDDGTRQTCIQAIGRALRERPMLFEALSVKLKPEYCERAFDAFVVANASELMDLASGVEDSGRAYRKEIRKHFAQNAAWLWNREDVGGALQSVEMRYRALELMRRLLKLSGWVTLEAACDCFLRAMDTSNPISLRLLAEHYPFLMDLHELLKLRGEWSDKQAETIVDQMKTNGMLVQSLFFDPSHAQALSCFREAMSSYASDLDDDRLLQIARAIDSAALRSKEDFLDEAIRRVRTPQEDVESLKDKLAALPAEMLKARLLILVARFPEACRALLEETP